LFFGQRTQLLWDIPLVESFKLNKDIYQISNTVYNQQLEFFDYIFKISELLDVSVRQLSLGQRMRAEICISMLHRPQILYMDEPTIGLDVVVKKKIMESIAEMNKEFGTTILLTTHDMTYVEQICNKALIMQNGKIIYNDSMHNLRKFYTGFTEIILKFGNNFIQPDNLLPNIVMNVIDNQTITIECQDSKDIPQILNAFSQHNTINNVEIKRALDDIMIELHKGHISKIG
jgi:ABC-2 type transport system ATP-binding protein